MVRKLALVGGVGVVWLVTFLVMGGSAVPSINLDAGPATSTTGPQGGPIETATPIGPGSATPTASSTVPDSVAAKAEALANAQALHGSTLAARPKARRSAPPRLTFRLATFNVLGSSHTAGRNRRASGPTRMRAATNYVLSHDLSLVGFQEMQGDQRSTFLNETGGKWGLWPGGTAHSGDGDNSIGYRLDTWELKEAFTVATPYFYGRTRNHPVLRLRNKQTGISIYILNVHSPADKHGPAQRWRNVTTAREIVLFNDLAKKGLPIFVTGDMNERTTWACKIVTGSDMRAAIGGDGRNGCTVPHNPFVDWIAGSYDVTFSNYVADNGVGSISDHPIVYTDATIDSRDFPKSVS